MTYQNLNLTLSTDATLKVSHKWPNIGNDYQPPQGIKTCTRKHFDLCFADQTLFEKSDHSRKDHIASFTQWFNENGGKAEHVLIDDFGQQGLGLRAASDIKVMSSFCYMYIHVLVE